MAATTMDGAASLAIDEESRQATTSVAAGLRGLLFAREADALLREGRPVPTGDQLAQSDAAVRGQMQALDAALHTLDLKLRPGPGASS